VTAGITDAAGEVSQSERLAELLSQVPLGDAALDTFLAWRTGRPDATWENLAGEEMPPLAGYLTAVLAGARGAGAVAAGQVWADCRAADERACKGPCNTPWRKTGKGSPREPDTYSAFCGKCQSTLARMIGELDGLMAKAARESDGYRQSTGADAAIRMHRGHSSGHRSPSPVTELESELTARLRWWLNERRPTAGRLGYHAGELYDLTSLLLRHIRAFTEHRPTAAAFYADIRTWYARLCKITKADRPLRSKPLPCPSCRQMGLTQEDGSDVVKCGNCGLIQPAKVYEARAAEAADSAEGVGPSGEAGSTGTEG
jgi:hypothetical protein